MSRLTNTIINVGNDEDILVGPSFELTRSLEPDFEVSFTEYLEGERLIRQKSDLILRVSAMNLKGLHPGLVT